MGMLRYLADENFNNDITRGLRLRSPRLDVIRIQETGIAGAADPAILAWTAKENRILLTHDRATIPAFAYARVTAREAMRGVFIINDRMPVRQAIDELLLINECSEPDEWEGLVVYLPL